MTGRDVIDNIVARYVESLEQQNAALLDQLKARSPCDCEEKKLVVPDPQSVEGGESSA